MKVLLDENLPRKLKRELTDHDARTMSQTAWRGVENGDLLPLVEGEFDAFITIDGNLPYQHKLERFHLRFVILHAVNNKLQTLRPLVPAILQALNRAQPGEVMHVPPQSP